jgi:hypothetical protein
MLDRMGMDGMRAADDDRQRVADALRTALNEGRLDLHEYDERLQQAYAAKTYGDLDPLLADLPAVAPRPQSRVAPYQAPRPAFTAPADAPATAGPATGGPAADPEATRRWLVQTWDDYGGAVGITVAIWLVLSLMAGDAQYFWPGWVAGPWGAYLLWETVRGLSTGEPQRWAAKQDRKQADRLSRKRAKRERRALSEGRLHTGADGKPAS